MLAGMVLDLLVVPLGTMLYVPPHFGGSALLYGLRRLVLFDRDGMTSKVLRIVGSKELFQCVSMGHDDDYYPY